MNASPLKRSLQRFIPAFAALAFITFFSHQADAVTRTWDGSQNDNWSTKQNWTPEAAPSPGDDLVFGGTAKLTTNTNNIAANTSFASITFDNTAVPSSLKEMPSHSAVPSRTTTPTRRRST